MRFHLFGSPFVVWDDTTLAISRRVVRALLYRLACDSEPVTRGHLQYLLWPDVPEVVARRNLSHHLTHLRRALPETLVVATRDEVWLEPSQTWCDVLAFMAAGLDLATDVAQLRHAVSLYRGPFLAGFELPACPEFQHWCLLERNALEQRYLKVLECLVERCTSSGEISQAIGHAQRYLETDSLSEKIHRRLIQLFAATGDRHLALRQFARCSSILESNLGVSPLPETQAVYQAVLRGEPRFPEPAPPMRPVRLLTSEIPFIGREDELARLEEAYLGLQKKQGQVVFISGEAGIGKSRLLQSFADRHRGETRLLYGCGHAGEQAIPYQPILSILRAILELDEVGRPQQEASAATGRPLPDFVEHFWLSEVSRLLPEMQAIYPTMPGPLPLEPETARIRLFDALWYTISAYATAHGPVLLCLDDLQWTDPTTRAWLTYTGRFLGRRPWPILILGAYRSEDAGDILDLRHTLARAGVLSELRLTGLTEAATVELARCLVGQRAGDEALARQLHQATGGNPFYLIETLHKLTEEGTLGGHLQEPMRFSLPKSVQEAVKDRVLRLSSVGRQVLEAGAVLGQAFDPDVLRLTAGRSHAELMSALEELAARGLLMEEQSRYRFKHELVGQYVEEDMVPIRRQLLHRRAGRAYQRLSPGAFTTLAWHFELGGDDQRALRYHGLAASRAWSMFAWQMAEFHQGRMLALLEKLDPGCNQPERVRQRGEALANRAYSRYLRNRLVERDADLVALHDLGEASRDDRVRLQALLNRLRYLNLDGEYAQAIAVAQRGLDLLGSSTTSEETEDESEVRSRLLAQLGLAYHYLGQPQKALGVLEEAWSLCAQRADAAACGRIQHVLGHVYSHLGDYARSLECQQRAYDYHVAADDSPRMAWDLIDIGVAYRNLGKPIQALQFVEKGLELSTHLGSQQTRAYGLARLGSLDLYRGDYSSALARCQDALEIQQMIRSEHVIAAAESVLGMAFYHLGNFAQGRHWLERALERSRATGHRRRVAKTLIQLGLLHRSEGRLTLGRQHLNEALETARVCHSNECLAAGLAAMAHLERLAGNHASALVTAAEALDAAKQPAWTSCEMWAEVEAGSAHLALGDPSSALEHSERAVELAPLAGQDWVGHEEAYWLQAQVLRALSQVEAADRFERCARETTRAKADLIKDPLQRRAFLSRSLRS